MQYAVPSNTVVSPLFFNHLESNAMNKIINRAKSAVQSFANDEEGAQVVEYALIIAVVSIGLVVALGGATGTGTLKAAFTSLVTRVTTCFTSTCV